MRYFSHKLQSKTLKFSMHWINREERKVTTILQISLSGVLKSHLCLYFTYSSPERLVILPTNEKPGHYQWQNSQKSDGLSAIVSTNWSPSPGKETKQEWRCCATPEPELQFQTLQDSTRSKTAPSSVCSAHAHSASFSSEQTVQGRFLVEDLW